jgi:chemotaxis protein methyltransferase CheR
MFRALVERETGIHLGEVKQALVHARLLSRLRELGTATFSDYYERVVQGSGDELVFMINAICTNETHFFREPAHFELLKTSLVPRFVAEAAHGLRPRRLRVWSAACSTGEEPYSVAMLLRALLPPEWSIEVLATDLSTKALAKAAAGVYPMQRLADVPAELRKRYLLRGVGSQAGKFRVSGALKQLVAFRRENLTTFAPSALGRFDLVLCRNVLMYFGPETRRRVVERLVDCLAHTGHLFVGHSETLHGFDARLRTVVPTVYQLEQEPE